MNMSTNQQVITLEFITVERIFGKELIFMFK
jgi:hypothetical protein